MPAVRLMQEKGTHSVSMQAIAKSCGVSVGLLYKYFSDKEQIVLAAITRVLEEFRLRVPSAIAEAAEPVDKVVAAFTEFCRIVDEQRHAVVLTYQVSRALSKQGLKSIQDQELETCSLVDVVTAAVEAGDLRDVNAQTLGHDLMATAHMWALKLVLPAHRARPRHLYRPAVRTSCSATQRGGPPLGHLVGVIDF